MLAVIQVKEAFPPTFPSSHCTSNLFPSSSSTTQPRTNAFAGSLSQTYLFPEKSFSPSILSTVGSAACMSSDLMNVGAKVPVCGVLPLFERLVESLLEGTELPFMGENDCVR
jgi:hypothetical protein